MRDNVSDFLGGTIHTGHVDLVDVHRQKDPLLKNLFKQICGMSGDAKTQLVLFKSLCASPLSSLSDGNIFNLKFDKPLDSYPDKLPRFPIFMYDIDIVLSISPNQTKIVSPRHKILEKMGR